MNNIIQFLEDSEIPLELKYTLISEIHSLGSSDKFKDVSIETITNNVDYLSVNKVDIDIMGYYGNVWIRQQYYKTANTVNEGHQHAHDHVSLLSSGSCIVHVDGLEPKKHVAPTFFYIPKEKNHKIVALEDETIAYCIFALRNQAGEVVNEMDGQSHATGNARVKKNILEID